METLFKKQVLHRNDMGYTRGRRLTRDFLEEQAKLYRTRSEFQIKDGSAYQSARRLGILDEICLHMKWQSFSIPQRITKQIFDSLLGLEGDYNTRKIIPPLEIDVFYSYLNFAVEYSGKGWHQNKDAKERDALKKSICQQRGIHLFVIHESSRKYEEDIKNQIINNIDFLNETFNLSIYTQAILDTKVDYDDVFKDTWNVDGTKEKISQCKSIPEFQKKYGNLYRILTLSNHLDWLDPIRTKRCHKNLSDKEVINLCQGIYKYHVFIKKHNWLYLLCYKRKILKKATAHMKRGRTANYCIDDIKKLAKGIKRKVDFKSQYSGAYSAALRMKIMDIIFPPDTYLKNQDL